MRETVERMGSSVLWGEGGRGLLRGLGSVFGSVTVDELPRSWEHVIIHRRSMEACNQTTFLINNCCLP